MEVINPATEEVITDLQEDTVDSINAKLKKLREGQKEWSKRSLEDRLNCITNFGKLIHEHKNDLAQTLTNETGKPLQQSLNEIIGAQNRIDHLSTNAKKWLADEVLIDSGPTIERISYEPLGVIANISAWNFPYNVGYNVFLYALISGNAVLYKPSEYALMTGMAFQKYMTEAGVPEDVFSCAIGGAKIGQAILEKDLDGYFFTGSYATGRHIANTVAPKLVPLQLELGGKDPLFIMNDITDIKQAAINAAEGAFYNNGQSCCAVERIYIEENIYDEFMIAFVNEVKSYKIGNPLELDTFIGPLARPQQIDILTNQVNDAVKKGAVLMLGGRAMNRKGYYFEPTILVNCTHEMLVMIEESFGPIIGIQKVHSDKEAIDLMKDTKFGLTSAVFSSNKERAMNVLGQMNSGTVYWNCCDRVSPNLPWSGRKNSGLGSTLSSQGIRAFVQPKAYHLRQS